MFSRSILDQGDFFMPFSRKYLRAMSWAIFYTVLFTSCGITDSTGQDWDWFGRRPSINFVTYDWKQITQAYTAGDSLTFIFQDWVRVNLAAPRILTATLTSSLGDTETVSIISNHHVPLPPNISLYAVYIQTGNRFPTKPSAVSVAYNGVLEIVGDVETITLTYFQPLVPIPSNPDTAIALTAEVLFRRR
jgi:hypothetical protein